MSMTGQELFETEDSVVADRDRRRHGSWERVPRNLQDWWNGCAAMMAMNARCGPSREPVFDWDEVKRAAREGAGR